MMRRYLTILLAGAFALVASPAAADLIGPESEVCQGHAEWADCEIGGKKGKCVTPQVYWGKPDLVGPGSSKDRLMCKEGAVPVASASPTGAASAASTTSPTSKSAPEKKDASGCAVSRAPAADPATVWAALAIAAMATLRRRSRRTAAH
jgi:MYXO-CTERM domain-containing protein